MGKPARAANPDSCRLESAARLSSSGYNSCERLPPPVKVVVVQNGNDHCFMNAEEIVPREPRS
jgi:hypothetical protein